MKQFIITEEERNRILEMHESRTSRHYLMESDDLQSQFESMIDEVGYQVIEDSFYGELTDDDMESFASIVSDMVNDKIQETNPNLRVDYTIYHGGSLEFNVFDTEEEYMVAEYRPNF